MIPVDKALSIRGEALHLYGAYVLYGVVALHILAVVWHRFVKQDGVLGRMWPSASRDRRRTMV